MDYIGWEIMKGFGMLLYSKPWISSVTVTAVFLQSYDSGKMQWRMGGKHTHNKQNVLDIRLLFNTFLIK